MKKTLKTIVVLTLILSMALSLAACGSTKEPEEETPEYVYASTFSDVKGGAKGYLTVAAVTENGSYAYSYEVTGRNIPEEVDTSAFTEDELSQYDEYGLKMYFIDNNDTISELTGYEQLPLKENTENFADFSSGVGLSGMAADKDGNLITIEYVYSNWFEGPEGMTWNDEEYYNYYKYIQEYYLRTLDPAGKELSCVPLELGEDQYLYGNMLTDDAGNLVSFCNESVIAFTKEGQIAYTIDCGNYVQTILALPDGKNYVCVWGDMGCELAPIDIETKALGAAVALPTNAYTPIAGGGDYDIYFTDGLYFCGYDMETETTEKLFNWINCDINSDNASNIMVGDDGMITGIINEYDQSSETYNNSRFKIEKVASSTLPTKETLTLACMWLDYNVRDMVIKFNRSSNTVRINVKDYSEFNTEDDYEAGSKKLLTEVMAGDAADIFSLNGLPYRQIAAKGLLEDLYPYIDSDKDFSRDDFFQNVFHGLEVNGKLYSSCPSFSINTVIGAKSVIGDKTSWTYDELDAALAEMPEGCDIFDQYTTRDDILQNCLNLDMLSYVDWSTGQCNFDSEQFVKLLEFANRFPETYEYTDDYTQEDSTENRVKQGKQMLIRTSIYGVDDLYYNSNFFGGDFVYIGYPTLSGSGNTISVESGYAIGSTCKNKEAAWEFLRTFFTEKYQGDNVWSIPTNLNVYEKKLAEAMKISYERDEKGEFRLDENGEKIMIPRYTFGSDDGETVNVYAMTQEQADQLWETINATTKVYDNDISIFNIVQEQAQAYFAGQKSAEEVAKLIQSKASIYVSEQA